LIPVAFSKHLIVACKEENMNEKISPDNIKIPIVYENKILIQLFDDLTGKQVDEVKTHNILTNGAAKMAYMDRYFARLKDGCNTSADGGWASASGSGGGNIYVPYGNPFDALVLSNTGLAENADIKFLYGTKVGWAEKTVAYAGVDNLRGTINLSETTFNEPNNFHYVFDFSTNAANGTFDTIFWHPFTANAFDLLYGTIGKYLNNVGSGYWNNGGKLAAYNGIVYGCVPGNDMIISEITVKLLTGAILNKSTNLESMTGGWITGIFVDANNIWLIASTNKIFKLDKNYNLITTINISNFPTGYSIPYGSGGGLAIYNGNFYSIFFKDGSNMLLCTMDSTGAVISSKDIGPDTSSRNISIRDTYLYVTDTAMTNTATTPAACGIYDLSNNLNKIGTFVQHVIGSSEGAFSSVAWDAVKQYWIGNFGYNGGGHGYAPMYLVPPGAMANVSPSVTKTATNTMKIQYDFNIELAVF
jgi:hypothetical protein